ncbi:MAG TPA: TraR/DksA C4-type zinc finger protein [Mycobacteriales bacterium]
MAERSGIATKLARALGGRGTRAATDETAEAAKTAAAAPKAAAKAAAKATAKTAARAPAKTAAKAATKTAAKSGATPTAKTAAARTAKTAKAPAKTAAKVPAKTATKTATTKTATGTATGTATTRTPVRAARASRGGAATTATTTTTTKATKATKATTRSVTTGTATQHAAQDGEYADIRTALVDRAAELRGEHDRAMSDINDLQRDRVADGAGDDQADAGTKTFEREQEISLANGILDRLTQVERALDRLDAGTYGRCERCGNAIPKARLEAFPSVTLCVSCKQIEERR